METLHSPASFQLEIGNNAEIVDILRELGASETICAQASTSFIVKLPIGTTIKKVKDGFEVGNSKLWERPSLALGAVTSFGKRAMNAMNDPMLQKKAA